MAQEADPRVLRAIAHPVRNRVLAELFAGGPLRAADVAGRIDIPANQASFHLRQLAKYGLVEEAPELARDGRDRVWRLVDDEGLDLDITEMERTPGGAAAVTVFRRQASAEVHAVVDRAYAPDHDKSVRVAIHDSSLRLTKDEAGTFSTELGELVNRWRDRTMGPAEDSRRIYRVLAITIPWDLES